MQASINYFYECPEALVQCITCLTSLMRKDCSTHTCTLNAHDFDFEILKEQGRVKNIEMSKENELKISDCFQEFFNVFSEAEQETLQQKLGELNLVVHFIFGKPTSTQLFKDKQRRLEIDVGPIQIVVCEMDRN